MRFLVTGASGLLGYSLTLALADVYGKSALQLVAAPLPIQQKERERLDALRAAGFDVLAIDLLDDELAADAFAPFDVLFHLAAFTETERKTSRVRVNDTGTARLLGCLGPRLSGKQVIYTSSVTVVDHPNGREHARTSYARTKLRGERFVRIAAEANGAYWTVLRLPIVAGPGFRKGGLFAKIAQDLRRGGLATGLAWPGKLSLIFVDDLVRALLRIAAEGRCKNGVYLAARPEQPTFDELAGLIAETLGLRRKRKQLPAWLWSLIRRVTWLPVLRLLPHAAWVPVWRISSVVSDCMAVDGSALNEMLGLEHTPLPEVLRQTYGVDGVHSDGASAAPPSCSIVIPLRNERGNVAATVARIPEMGRHTEILLIEGHSSDGTLAECFRVRDANPNRDIKVMVQDGAGKGNAVRMGFAHASGDILVVHDGDLTVAPEDLPAFFDAVAANREAVAIGSRFDSPMAPGAMPRLNRLANRWFALELSCVVAHRLTDALCGTKAIPRAAYPYLLSLREKFSEQDPFGDFDILFLAAYLGLEIKTIPVKYHRRTYGSSSIRHFREGWRLLRVAAEAAWRLRM